MRHGGQRSTRLIRLPTGVLAAVLVGLLAVAPPALGQPAGDEAAPETSPEPSAADKETARNLVAVGDEKYQAGDYEGALQAYQGADAIMGVPTTGIEVGRAQFALGQLVEARDTLLRVSRYPQLPDEPEAFTNARERAADMAEDVARRIPTIQIDVRGVPVGTTAEVRLDGQVVEPATVGLPRKINPGRHVVKVTAPGMRVVEIDVALAEQEQRVVEVSMHPLVVDKPPPPPEEEEGVSPLVVSGFGLGAVGLALGVVTGAVSLSIAADVKDQCTDNLCPKTVESDADQSLTLAHVSTASFIAGGVGMLLGIIGAAVSGDGSAEAEEQTARGLSVEPMVGPGTIGLQGQF